MILRKSKVPERVNVDPKIPWGRVSEIEQRAYIRIETYHCKTVQEIHSALKEVSGSNVLEAFKTTGRVKQATPPTHQLTMRMLALLPHCWTKTDE